MNIEPVSVSWLNNYIKGLIDGDGTLRAVAVRGEMSNFRPNPSGHMYFSMKDEVAAIRSVMFRGSASKLKFRPENGMSVVAVGYVSVFTRDGAYQLYVNELIPDGVGDLFLAFEQLKAKLAAEGLFDAERKKPIPRFPAKIALVTSPSGAAVQDMLRILKKRYPPANVLVVPVKVQGEGAAEEIAAGISLVNQKNAASLIITGRGGGSIEDLWCFNEEIVARAIAGSRIPVISAVGHEPDFTIADFAADLRAATPSNAAELAVPDIEELYTRTGEYAAAMRKSVVSRLSLLSQRLSLLSAKRVFQSPGNYVDERRLHLDYAVKRLGGASERIISARKHRFAAAAAALDAMSPLKVLGRGYSIAVRADGSAARRAQELSAGERLSLRLAEGSVRCEVLENE